MRCAALLVGWNGPEPNALQYAEVDCVRMKRALQELNFETVEMILPPTLSPDGVLKAFRQLAGKRPELLLCFFAGHAELSEGGLLAAPGNRAASLCPNF